MSNDNEGLWTGMYAVSQAMWYKATGSPTAKANAWAAFTGLELLNKGTLLASRVVRVCRARVFFFFFFFFSERRGVATLDSQPSL